MSINWGHISKMMRNQLKANKPAEHNIVQEPAISYQVTVPFASTLAYLGGLSVFPKNVTLRGKFDFISLIRKGISMKSLNHLMRVTGISSSEMADIIHTSDRTLRRYTSETLLNPEQSERAIELASLYSRGEEVFGSSDAFKEWMNSTVLSIGNKKPKELLDTSIGIELLIDELGRIEYGVFA